MLLWPDVNLLSLAMLDICNQQIALQYMKCLTNSAFCIQYPVYLGEAFVPALVGPLHHVVEQR